MSSIAERRYRAQILILSAVYATLLFGASYVFKHQLVDGPTACLAAVLPALPIIGIFVSIGRYLVDERDEYLRMLMVRQTLWASGFALAISTVWGFLESFGVVAHVEAYAVAILWFGGLGLGSVANRLTFGQDEGRGQ